MRAKFPPRQLSFRLVVSCATMSASLLLISPMSAWAFKAGHGRVDSMPGMPLQISIPLLELSTQDVQALTAQPAEAASWSQANLTPPVPLDSLKVSIRPGYTQNSRTLVIQSTQAVNEPLIDILINVVTASGSTPVQSSFSVLTQPKGSGSTIVVRARDTLSGIAARYPVPDADLYQQLWALFQANPGAFYSNNMNLLRTGATLTIPSAATVVAIDKKLARDMYAKHLAAFRLLGTRDGSSSASVPVAQPAGSTQVGQVISVATSPAAPSGDQVRLSTASSASQLEDMKTATAKEMAEIQSRVDALQQNVQELKEVVAQSAGAAAVTANSSAMPSNAAASTTGASSSTPQSASGVSAASSPASAPTTASARAASSSGAGESSQVSSASTSHTLTSIDRLMLKVTDNLFLVLTALLMIGGLIIALIMRHSAARRDDSDDEALASNEQAVKEQIERKIGGLDLNLDSEQPALRADARRTKPR